MVFILALPLLLLAWAHAAEPNIGLQAWGNLPWGIALTLAGLAVLAGGLANGGKLALWVPRPVYSGFSMLCFGISMSVGSRAGLWLVSPAVSLAGAALAAAGFGAEGRVLPDDDDSTPALHERVRFWFAAALPWVALYEFTVHLRLPGRAFQFAFEDGLPIYPSTSLLYLTTYAVVAAAPFLARTRRELRRLTISAWVAMAIVFPFYWLVPSMAPLRAMSGGEDRLLARLLALERRLDPPAAAFPSFHVLWSIFIVPLVRPRWLGWLYAAAVAVSCVTTGKHFIPDVLASFAIAPFFLEPAKWMWDPLRRLGAAPSWLAHGLLILVLASMWIQSAPIMMMAGVALIGVGLSRVASSGQAGWRAGAIALCGVCLTCL